MSRKHFKRIADAFYAQRPAEHWDPNKLAQWNMDVKAVARACYALNPGFKFERFYAACGELFQKDGFIL